MPPTARTATAARVVEPVRAEDGTRLFRCSDCRALLRDAADGRAHLEWHDTVVTR